MSRKTILIWVFFMLLGIFAIKMTQRPLLHVTMCDVGQGDAYVISYKSYQMVIDGGSNRRILECLHSVMPMFDKTIEVVVATHPDKDHIAGLVYVLTMYKVDQIITNGKEKQTSTFEAFQNAVEQSPATKIIARQGQQFMVGEAIVRVLWPEENYNKTISQQDDKNNDKSSKSGNRQLQNIDDTNAGSIVLRLEFGGFSALFTGDLEIPQEEKLLTSGNLLPVTLLKVGHHGSRYSTSDAFLEKLKPSIAFIGVGKGNTYGHPTKRVIDLLEEKGVTIYRSDEDGQVTLETNGSSIKKI